MSSPSSDQNKLYDPALFSIAKTDYLLWVGSLQSALKTSVPAWESWEQSFGVKVPTPTLSLIAVEVYGDTKKYARVVRKGFVFAVFSQTNSRSSIVCQAVLSVYSFTAYTLTIVQKKKKISCEFVFCKSRFWTTRTGEECTWTCVTDCRASIVLIMLQRVLMITR